MTRTEFIVWTRESNRQGLSKRAPVRRSWALQPVVEPLAPGNASFFGELRFRPDKWPRDDLSQICSWQLADTKFRTPKL